MKNLAILLLALGIILGIYAMAMDTSVAVNYPNGNSFGFPDRINNLGLMSDRQNYLIVSGIMVILGCALLIVGKNTSQDNSAMKTCPQCAEKVKFEAKICRYCNYNFGQSNPDMDTSETKTFSGKTLNELYTDGLKK